MVNQAEAKKIWNEMCVLEREQPGTSENKLAFFKNKAKKMKELKAAYDKATGLTNPTTSIKHNEGLGARKIQRAIRGQADAPETRDTLNDN